MFRQRRWLLLVVVVVAAVGGYWYWSRVANGNAADRLVAYGNVDVRQVELAINGVERIAQVLVEEGDHIERGQLLATLELERFELAVQRAQARLETQQQVVAGLEAGSRPEEIAKARADFAAAQAIRQEAESSYRRSVELRERSAISQQDLDDAKAAFDSALAREQAAKATLDLVVAGPRKEDIAQARALLKQLEAELALAQHDLQDAHLYAPSDGVVEARILEVGDMASPTRPIYTVALDDPVWVRAYISEPDLGRLAEGMPAYVETDSFPGKQYEGWIGFISPTAEFTPKPVETPELRTKLVYQIRVFVRNPHNELRLGMPVTVSIPLKRSVAAAP